MTDPYYNPPAIGSSWSGAGDHENHTVTQTQNWLPRIYGATVEFDDKQADPFENATVTFEHGAWKEIRREDGTVIPFDGRKIHVRDGVLDCGRVRCSCGEEWNVGGWPADLAHVVEPKAITS